MRCVCCDVILTDFEATRKFKESNTYADMCTTCVKTLPDDIEFIVRGDLVGEQSPEEFDLEDGDDDAIIDGTR
jgi:hypothetical protein